MRLSQLVADANKTGYFHAGDVEVRLEELERAAAKADQLGEELLQVVRNCKDEDKRSRVLTLMYKVTDIASTIECAYKMTHTEDYSRYNDEEDEDEGMNDEKVTCTRDDTPCVYCKPGACDWRSGGEDENDDSTDDGGK